MGENEIKKIFSKNFNRLLKLHEKTQKDISDDLGYHRATVSEWARGTKYPRMDKVERLAQYFNVQISELIDDIPSIETISSNEEPIPVFDDPQVRALARKSFNKNRNPEKEKLLKKLIQSMLEED